MQRIERIDEASAPRDTASLLTTVRARMGGVPNLLATMAHSSAALGGYLGLADALAGGRLPAALREQIALAVAGVNHCDYCASAHTLLGAKAGLAADELARALEGTASDPRAQAALRFATRVAIARGAVSDGDLDAVRRAGFSDEDVIEIAANTVLNLFTNYLNHIAATEVDFPLVRTADLAAA